MIKIRNCKEKIVLKVKKLDKNVEIPEYAMKTDLGFDLRANEDIVIPQSEQKTIKTGLLIEIPEGHIGLIRDRAGIITKMGLHTAAGTFDPGYRGEISIVMVNLGDEDVEIEKGMRIAQMIILPVLRPKIKEVKEVSKTERNDKGFNSTGIKEILREISKNSKK